jgi:hypothetical protein
MGVFLLVMERLEAVLLPHAAVPPAEPVEPGGPPVAPAPPPDA